MKIKAIKRIQTYDKYGEPERNRYIDIGDICTVLGVGANLMFEVQYPTSSGFRTAYLPSLQGVASGFVIYNQNDYAHIKYPAEGYEGATIKSSGCGVVAACMVVENLLGESLTPFVCAKIAQECGARVSGGTDMRVLSRVLCSDFGMRCAGTNDLAKVVASLKNGAVAIANVGGDRAGRKGVFSSGGHYVSVLGVEGDGKLLIADPALYSGKYDKPHRSAVTVCGAMLTCTTSVLDKDCESRSPKYYIFEK